MTINKCLNKAINVKRGKGAFWCDGAQGVACDAPLDEVTFRNAEFIFYRNCD